MSSPGQKVARPASNAWQLIREINNTLEIPAILRRLVAAAMDLVAAEQGGAAFLEDDQLVFREYNNKGQLVPIDYKFPTGYGVPGHVMATRRPYFSNDAAHDPHVIPEIQKAIGFFNLVDVPILDSEGRLLGCFEIHNTVGKRNFDQSDVSILEGLASIGAVAIRNAQMVEQVRLSEATLKTSEASFRVLFAANPLPMFVRDLDKKGFIEVNQAAIDVYGYSREEFLEMNVFDLDYGADPSELAQLVNQEEPYRGVRRHKLKDGRIIYVELATRQIEFEGRRARISVTQNITESVEARQRLMVQRNITLALAQSNDFDEAVHSILRNFCEDLGWDVGVMCVPSSSGKVMRCGYQWPSPELGLDLSAARRESSDESQPCMCEVASSVGAPVWRSLEGRQVDAPCLKVGLAAGMKTALAVPIVLQGKMFGVMDFMSRETRPEDEKLIALVVQIASEIGQFMKRAKAEEEHARLIRAVEQAGESIVITDADGIILYVNPAFERITGYASEEVLGVNPRVLKSGRQPEEFYRDLWASLARGETWSGKFINRRKDGRLFEEEGTISPVRDSAGHIINYVSVKRDVTAERLLQEQLRQSQKMEAIGQLAGGVAHDFNNMLGVIMGYSELLLERLPQRDRSYKAAEEIRAAAERAAGLTRQLLAFSRKQVLEPKVLDLNALVSDLVKMLTRMIGESVELSISPGIGIGHIKADPGQIEQVIINLAVNARDAMPNGGKLLIETAEVTIGEFDTIHERRLQPGRYVVFTISDSGAGMSPEVKDRIFEPFFTTKAVGKGTGLGLSTVYGIVRQSGGHIFVDSVVGEGTVFSIYLPRAEGKAEEIAPIAPSPMLSGGETLLLVEDEGAARELIARLLRDQRYTVLEAENGFEALKIVDKHNGKLQLVITDLVMPKMGGFELAAILKQTHPGLKVLFMSGYAEDHGKHPDLDESHEILSKPFHVRDLARKIREQLDK